jgi:hypothetical protein
MTSTGIFILASGPLSTPRRLGLGESAKRWFFLFPFFPFPLVAPSHLVRVLGHHATPAPIFHYSLQRRPWSMSQTRKRLQHHPRTLELALVLAHTDRPAPMQRPPSPHLRSTSHRLHRSVHPVGASVGKLLG